MTQFSFTSRRQLLATRLEPGHAVVSMRDPLTPRLELSDSTPVLHLECHDIAESMPGLTHPDPMHAAEILRFVRGRQRVVFACEAGAGRSQACFAAFEEGLKGIKVRGDGTYNRLLYRLLREAMGKPVPPEPLVSIVCRVKYPADRACAMAFCMQRQRHENWELLFVTDGPAPELAEMSLPFSRIKILETTDAKGLWGHPYRQLGIDAARGDFIGLSNDDNYYVPGYLEQMVFAMEAHNADLAFCDQVHSYTGWCHVETHPVKGSPDLGCFIGRRELIQSVKWPGNEFTSDGDYVELLMKEAKRVAFVRRPLFVHN